MMKAHHRRVLVSAIAGAALLLAAPGGASAAPRLTFSPDADADAGQPISVTWSASGLPSDTRLSIQRRQGTAGAWRTSKVLTSRRGTTSLSGLPLGRYRLRLAAVSPRRGLLGQRAATVRVYGRVTFAKLFDATPETLTTPTFTFEYTLHPGGLTTGPSYPEVGRENPCRRVHAEFVPTGDAGSTGIVRLLQATRDPVISEAAVDGRGVVDGPVVPGRSWSLYSQQGAGNSGIQMYIDGFAECYSDEPLTD